LSKIICISELPLTLVITLLSDSTISLASMHQFVFFETQKNKSGGEVS